MSFLEIASRKEGKKSKKRESRGVLAPGRDNDSFQSLAHTRRATRAARTLLSGMLSLMLFGLTSMFLERLARVNSYR